MNTIPDEVLSRNPAVDRHIKSMLTHFDTTSQQRMTRKIRQGRDAAQKQGDENTDAGARHIFREIIPAAHLNEAGFALEYERQVDGKCPDWLDETNKLMIESYTFERGGSSSFETRLRNAIATKCDKYQNTIVANSLRFVVAVHLDFLSGMTLRKCGEHLENLRASFDGNDVLWGVLFFAETTVVDEQQMYGFLAVARDPPADAFVPHWPFPTKCV